MNIITLKCYNLCGYVKAVQHNVSTLQTQWPKLHTQLEFYENTFVFFVMSRLQKQSSIQNVQCWSKLLQIINSNNTEIFAKSVLSSSYSNILVWRKAVTFAHTVQFVYFKVIKINLRRFVASSDVTPVERSSSGCFVCNYMQLKKKGKKDEYEILIVYQWPDFNTPTDHLDRLRAFTASESPANVSTDHSCRNFLIPQRKLFFSQSSSEQ